MAQQPRIVYEVSEQDLATDLSKRSVLERFRDRLISAKAVAEIHNTTADTVIRYAKARLIPYEMRGKLYKFSLAEVLQIDFHQLRGRA